MAKVTLERMTLEQVAEKAKELTPNEQQRLRGLLEGWITPTTLSTEELEARERLFAQRLLEKGIITHIPERDPDYEAHRHPPIVVEGEPVSETILRERR
jgi:hypothetical protein